MKKEELTESLLESGISEEIVNFITSDSRNNKSLNAEGLEIGDKIKIIGIADKISESVIDKAVRQWVDVLTTGDRNTISVSRLVGTNKRAKYFASNRPNTQVIEGGYDNRKLLTLPNREGDALLEIANHHINITYEVVAIAEQCGQFEQTFYLFAEA